MQFGISVYPGLDNTLEENLLLIEKAAKKGIRRIFTSFHIPETNKSVFHKEIAAILETAKQHDMDIIADISPQTSALLGVTMSDLRTLKNLGITTLRLDYGYSPQEISILSNNNQNIHVQLNASTLDTHLLSALQKENANFDNIDALHNFYPRTGTGISERTLIKNTILLHKNNIKTGAFIPSFSRPRSPLKAGLPTLEMHRNFSTGLAARHLAAIGTDSIFIGDSLPSDDEMAALAKTKSDCVAVQIKVLTNNKEVKNILQSMLFTSRNDDARDSIRSQESRDYIQNSKIHIPQENTTAREYGDITIDNETAGRYWGELQIIKSFLPPDSKVNVVAKIQKDNLFLLDYILPGHKFSFFR